MKSVIATPSRKSQVFSTSQGYQEVYPTTTQANLHYLVKFTIAMFVFLCTMVASAQCSNAERVVRNHQDGILELLLSSGDTNVYTEVIDCDYSWWEDKTEITHYISFNGIWTGTKYQAIGKLIIEDNEVRWFYLKGNDAMNEYLIQMGLLAVVAYAAEQ